MARNNNKMVRQRREPKIEPAVMKIVSTTAVPVGEQILTFDLSQMTSLLNRRFYRQGLVWAVAGIKVTSESFTGPIWTNKLPSTWTMSNAWHKGFAAWQTMNRDALEESPSIRPRFLDYKVFANAPHHNAGFAANQLPISMNSQIPLPVLDFAVAGEWESSKMTVPFGPASPGNVTDYEILAVGGNYPGVSPASGMNAVSLVQGYANSRGLPDITDPNAPAEAVDADGSTPENWLAATFNEGTEQTTEIIENMLLENNIAPYPFENDGVNLVTMYPGGASQLSGLEIHDVAQVTSTTVGAKTRIPGGLFPCGLIQLWLNNQAEATGQLLFEISLVPGEHRGYLAQPMQDM